MRTLLLFVVGGLLILSGSAGAASQAAPRTLVSAQTRITAFGQDGRYIAWSTVDRSCHDVVRLRDLARGRTFVLTRPGTPGCRMTAPVRQLAVAGSGGEGRALWTRYETGNNAYHWLFAGSSRSREREAGLVTKPTDEELHVPLAGNAAFLGYGWSHVADDKEAGIPYTVLDGGVARIGADLQPTVERLLPPAAMLAAGGGRVALVPRGDLHQPTSPRQQLRDVHVLSGSTLEPLGRVGAGGAIQAVAVSATTLAVLVGNTVETYDRSGRLSTRAAVPARAVRDLELAGSRVVYRVGRSIYVLGRRAPVAVASSEPIGLSADGSRLTWAENVAGRGRIRALTLP